MKKIHLKSFFEKQKTLRILLSVLLLTVGVYCAYPVRGVLACYPLSFLFSAAAFLIWSDLRVQLAAAAGVAFFYAMTTDFTDPFTFAIFALLSALFAALAVRALKKLGSGKKWLLSLLFLLSLGAGIALPMIFFGLPTTYLQEREEAKAYLAEHYPDQRFSSMTFCYQLPERGYEAEVSYEYEGNLLTSRIFFGEKVEDGFLKDYTSWLQEKRKSTLIDLVNGIDANLVVDAAGLAMGSEDGVYRGSYGVVNGEMEPLFHFKATFREEKPERRDFADACVPVLTTLQEAGFDYGAITFYALDAGYVVYECTVTPETQPDEVLGLIRRPS